MRKLLLMAMVMIPCLLMMPACDPEPVESPEENLKISTDAVNNSEILGSTYDFNVMVESVMPPSGVTISVKVIGESDNRNYSTVSNIMTSNKTTQIRLNGLPQQQYCLCSVTVTSKTRSTNTQTLGFRIIQK